MRPHPYLLLVFLQGKHHTHAAPLRVAARRCRRERLPFSWHGKYFVHALNSPCYLLFIVSTNPGPGQSSPPLEWRDIRTGRWLVVYEPYIGKKKSNGEGFHVAPSGRIWGKGKYPNKKTQ